MEKYNYLSLMDVQPSGEPLYYPGNIADSLFLASDPFDFDADTPVFCFTGNRGSGRTEAAKAIARINDCELWVVDNTKLRTNEDMSNLFNEIYHLFLAEGGIVLLRNLDFFDSKSNYSVYYLSEFHKKSFYHLLRSRLRKLQYDKFPNNAIVLVTMDKCEGKEDFTDVVSFEYDDQDLLHIMRDYWDYKKGTVDDFTKCAMDEVDTKYKRQKEQFFDFYVKKFLLGRKKVPSRAVAAIRGILSFQETETDDPALGLLRNLLFRAFSWPYNDVALEALIEDNGWPPEDLELLAVTKEEKKN